MCLCRIPHRSPCLAPGRWYLWTVYKSLTYGILRRFVTFICCHPVYLFYANLLKVSPLLPASVTSGWRKDPQPNLKTEQLSKRALHMRVSRACILESLDRTLQAERGGNRAAALLPPAMLQWCSFRGKRLPALDLAQLTWRREGRAVLGKMCGQHGRWSQVTSLPEAARSIPAPASVGPRSAGSSASGSLSPPPSRVGRQDSGTRRPWQTCPREQFWLYSPAARWTRKLCRGFIAVRGQWKQEAGVFLSFWKPR